MILVVKKLIRGRKHVRFCLEQLLELAQILHCARNKYDHLLDVVKWNRQQTASCVDVDTDVFADAHSPNRINSVHRPVARLHRKGYKRNCAQ
jgi:hypothetical protein